jgi:hypothetical protein
MMVRGAVKGALIIPPNLPASPTIRALKLHKSKTQPGNKQQSNKKKQYHPNA